MNFKNIISSLFSTSSKRRQRTMVTAHMECDTLEPKQMLSGTNDPPDLIDADFDSDLEAIFVDVETHFLSNVEVHLDLDGDGSVDTQDTSAQGTSDVLFPIELAPNSSQDADIKITRTVTNPDGSSTVITGDTLTITVYGPTVSAITLDSATVNGNHIDVTFDQAEAVHWANLVYRSGDDPYWYDIGSIDDANGSFSAYSPAAAGETFEVRIAHELSGVTVYGNAIELTMPAAENSSDDDDYDYMNYDYMNYDYMNDSSNITEGDDTYIDQLMSADGEYLTSNGGEDSDYESYLDFFV